MSDTMQITPEDRERLAKGKFKEWFDELFDSKIEEAVKKHVGSTAKTAASKGTESDGGGQQQQQQDSAPRRRSLLETCLSDTFGF